MIKFIYPQETYSLRRDVLRKNMPNEPHEFKGDFDEGTFHLGFFENDIIVGILTLMKTDEKTFQLRGMAVADTMQGKNIGRKLVEHAECFLKTKNISKIWMNAREKAIPFYEKCGYQSEGDFFEINPIGTHIKMIKVF